MIRVGFHRHFDAFVKMADVGHELAVAHDHNIVFALNEIDIGDDAVRGLELVLFLHFWVVEDADLVVQTGEHHVSGGAAQLHVNDLGRSDGGMLFGLVAREEVDLVDFVELGVEVFIVEEVIGGGLEGFAVVEFVN